MNSEKTKIRILHYIVATHLGGAERSLLDLVLMQKKSGDFHPIVLAPLSNGPLTDLLKANDIELHVVSMPEIIFFISRSKPVKAIFCVILSVFSGIPYFFELRRKCKFLKANVLYTTGLKCHLIGTLLGCSIRLPVIWHLRDILSKKISRLFYLFFKYGNVKVIANSKASMISLTGQNEFENRKDQLIVIPNGLDSKVFYPKRHNDLKAEVGCPINCLLIGIVGVLAKWKGHEDFIEVASQLLKKNIDIYFVVVGDEIYDTGNQDRGFRKRLEDRVVELGISKRIRFVGYKKDSAWVMNGIDILVHASRQPEPFGRVIIEAMSCGTVVVASGEGGVMEIVQDSKTGLLFEPRSNESMEEKLTDLILSDKLRLDLSDAAVFDFRQRFTLDSHFRRISEFIEFLKSLRTKLNLVQ